MSWNCLPEKVDCLFIKRMQCNDHFWNGFVKNMGPIDILALQIMYGKSKKRNNDNTIYNLPIIKPKLNKRHCFWNMSLSSINLGWISFQLDVS